MTHHIGHTTDGMTQVFSDTFGPAHAVFSIDYLYIDQCVHYGTLFHSSARACAKGYAFGFWRVKGGNA